MSLLNVLLKELTSCYNLLYWFYVLLLPRGFYWSEMIILNTYHNQETLQQNYVRRRNSTIRTSIRDFDLWYALTQKLLWIIGHGFMISELHKIRNNLRYLLYPPLYPYSNSSVSKTVNTNCAILYLCLFNVDTIDLICRQVSKVRMLSEVQISNKTIQFFLINKLGVCLVCFKIAATLWLHRLIFIGRWWFRIIFQECRHIAEFRAGYVRVCLLFLVITLIYTR